MPTASPYLFRAMTAADLPLIQGLVLVFGALFILVNLATDALVAWFNPRMEG